MVSKIALVKLDSQEEGRGGDDVETYVADRVSNAVYTDRLGSNFLHTVVAVNKHPKQFFEQMTAEEGNYAESALLLSLFMIFPAIEPLYFNNLDTMFYVFPAIIVAGIFSAWLWSEYVNRVLSLFLNIDVNKKDVFRVVSYASASNVLHLTLFLSPAVFMWQIYLMWRGFVSHLGLKGEVAAWLVVIPLVLAFCFGLAILMFLALSGIDFVAPHLEFMGIDEFMDSF